MKNLNIFVSTVSIHVKTFIHKKERLSTPKHVSIRERCKEVYFTDTFELIYILK